jgi:hypothetical protein
VPVTKVPKKKVTHLLKKYYPIPTDGTGKPILPIQLGGMTILDLGKVVYDKPKFHAKRYIWPVGFKVGKERQREEERDRERRKKEREREREREREGE